MSRQSDADSEERESKKRDLVITALSFGIHDGLKYHGADLRGISIKYDDWNILLTVRADRGGIRAVSFIGSDTIINAFLKLYREAWRDDLVWKEDAYTRSGH